MKRQKKPTKQHREENLSESELFLDAMQDVKPLQHSNHIDQYNAETQKQQSYQKLKKLRQQRAPERPQLQQHNLDTSQPIGAFDPILHHKKGLRLHDLNKLKKSEFRLNADLDLHGKTAEEASEAIDIFIREALAFHWKYIRIIHGKGYNSESDFPILKNLCYQKLKRLKAVVAFCSAPEKDGGVGAVNVQLKSD